MSEAAFHQAPENVLANEVDAYPSRNRQYAELVDRQDPTVYASKETHPPIEQSLIDSDMQIPGILAKTVQAVADSNISVLAVHQSMRQVDMQFIVNESDYEATVKSLHSALVEVHDHGQAICLAS